MLLTTGCTIKVSPSSVVDISKTDMTQVENLKSGEACAKSLLGFPLSLNATAKEAAKEAGISKIVYQENSSTDLLIYRSYCTKVYGK